GIKPLYWALTRDGLLFASEIKAILASGLVEARPNEARLPEVLSTRYISGPETLFQNIEKLLPGHLLVFERGQTSITQYWDLPVARPTGFSYRREGLRVWRDQEIVAEFRRLLEESIRLRLMSDVPL